jgi:hypothetical protein
MTRSLLSLIAIIICSLLAAGPAVAETRKLDAHPSRTQLAAACEAAGGHYADVPADKEMGSPANYHCTTNCSGKQSGCMVMCSDSGCVGSTPSQLTGGQTLLGILQNGDSVFRRYDPVTTAGTGGGDDSSAGSGGSGGGDPGPADPAPGDGGCGLEFC